MDTYGYMLEFEFYFSIKVDFKTSNKIYTYITINALDNRKYNSYTKLKRHLFMKQRLKRSDLTFPLSQSARVFCGGIRSS